MLTTVYLMMHGLVLASVVQRVDNAHCLAHCRKLPLLSPGLVQLCEAFRWAYKRRGLVISEGAYNRND